MVNKDLGFFSPVFETRMFILWLITGILKMNRYCSNHPCGVSRCSVMESVSDSETVFRCLCGPGTLLPLSLGFLAKLSCGLDRTAIFTIGPWYLQGRALETQASTQSVCIVAVFPGDDAPLAHLTSASRWKRLELKTCLNSRWCDSYNTSINSSGICLK